MHQQQSRDENVPALANNRKVGIGARYLQIVTTGIVNYCPRPKNFSTTWPNRRDKMTPDGVRESDFGICNGRPKFYRHRAHKNWIYPRLVLDTIYRYTGIKPKNDRSEKKCADVRLLQFRGNAWMMVMIVFRLFTISVTTIIAVQTNARETREIPPQSNWGRYRIIRINKPFCWYGKKFVKKKPSIGARLYHHPLIQTSKLEPSFLFFENYNNY